MWSGHWGPAERARWAQVAGSCRQQYFVTSLKPWVSGSSPHSSFWGRKRGIPFLQSVRGGWCSTAFPGAPRCCQHARLQPLVASSGLFLQSRAPGGHLGKASPTDRHNATLRGRPPGVLKACQLVARVLPLVGLVCAWVAPPASAPSSAGNGRCPCRVPCFGLQGSSLLLWMKGQGARRAAPGAPPLRAAPPPADVGLLWAL